MARDPEYRRCGDGRSATADSPAGRLVVDECSVPDGSENGTEQGTHLHGDGTRVALSPRVGHVVLPDEEQPNVVVLACQDQPKPSRHSPRPEALGRLHPLQIEARAIRVPAESVEVSPELPLLA